MRQYDPEDRPDYGDEPLGFWECPFCGANNSELDGDCQYCDEDAPRGADRE